MNHEVLITVTPVYPDWMRSDEEDNDNDVPGVYRIRFQSDEEDREALIDEALDMFHDNIGIEELDDFNFDYVLVEKTAHQKLSEIDNYDPCIDTIEKIK